MKSYVRNSWTNIPGASGRDARGARSMSITSQGAEERITWTLKPGKRSAEFATTGSISRTRNKPEQWDS
jgi:hypothetical protein